MKVIPQTLYGTAAEWTAANQVLAEGEIGVETDTGKIKIGDGLTVWNSLAYSNLTPAELGTAASEDVTTSATDTFAGRLLKVGDYGAGAAAGTTLLGTGNTPIQPDATQFIVGEGVNERLRIDSSGKVIKGGASGPLWAHGTGTPEGVVTAPVGSFYSRTDGGAGTSFYVKESGTGNTGWVAKL